MTSMNTSKPVFLTKPLWWGMFALDTFLLSKCFHTFKTYTLTPDLNNGLLFATAILGFVLALSVLVFDSYAIEKTKGNIHKPFFLEAEILSRMRSPVTSRSYSAKLISTLIINLPAGVLVLICWVMETKETLWEKYRRLQREAAATAK